MAVAFDEQAGSPTFTGTISKLTGQRVGYIDWGDRDAMYLEMFPGTLAGIPQLPSLFPGSAVLYGAGVDYKPPPGAEKILSCSSSAANTYEKCLATLSYETIPYEQDDPNADQILTRRFSIGAEMMIIPNHGLKWAGDGARIMDPDVEGGIVIPTIQLDFTLHRVTEAFFTAFMALTRTMIGTTNDDAFYGFPAETLLYLGGDFEHVVQADFNQAWTVSVRMAQKQVNQGAQSVGWNHLYRPDAGQFQRVKTMNDKDIYQLTDFDLLW